MVQLSELLPKPVVDFYEKSSAKIDKESDSRKLYFQDFSHIYLWVSAGNLSRHNFLIFNTESGITCIADKGYFSFSLAEKLHLKETTKASQRIKCL